MVDKTNGMESVLSVGITGDEPQLGGPLGDGRSWGQFQKQLAQETSALIEHLHREELRAYFATREDAVFRGLDQIIKSGFVDTP